MWVASAHRSPLSSSSSSCYRSHSHSRRAVSGDVWCTVSVERACAKGERLLRQLAPLLLHVNPSIPPTVCSICVRVLRELTERTRHRATSTPPRERRCSGAEQTMTTLHVCDYHEEDDADEDENEDEDYEDDERVCGTHVETIHGEDGACAHDGCRTSPPHEPSHTRVQRDETNALSGTRGHHVVMTRLWWTADWMRDYVWEGLRRASAPAASALVEVLLALHQWDVRSRRMSQTGRGYAYSWHHVNIVFALAEQSPPTAWGKVVRGTLLYAVLRESAQTRLSDLVERILASAARVHQDTTTRVGLHDATRRSSSLPLIGLLKPLHVVTQRVPHVHALFPELAARVAEALVKAVFPASSSAACARPKGADAAPCAGDEESVDAPRPFARRGRGARCLCRLLMSLVSFLLPHAGEPALRQRWQQQLLLPVMHLIRVQLGENDEANDDDEEEENGESAMCEVCDGEAVHARVVVRQEMEWAVDCMSTTVWLMRCYASCRGASIAVVDDDWTAQRRRFVASFTHSLRIAVVLNRLLRLSSCTAGAGRCGVPAALRQRLCRAREGLIVAWMSLSPTRRCVASPSPTCECAGRRATMRGTTAGTQGTAWGDASSSSSSSWARLPHSCHDGPRQNEDGAGHPHDWCDEHEAYRCAHEHGSLSPCSTTNHAATHGKDGNNDAHGCDDAAMRWGAAHTTTGRHRCSGDMCVCCLHRHDMAERRECARLAGSPVCSCKELVRSCTHTGVRVHLLCGLHACYVSAADAVAAVGLAGHAHEGHGAARMTRWMGILWARLHAQLRRVPDTTAAADTEKEAGEACACDGGGGHGHHHGDVWGCRVTHIASSLTLFFHLVLLHRVWYGALPRAMTCAPSPWRRWKP